MLTKGGGFLRPTRVARMEKAFTGASSGAFSDSVGGIPFYGNIYSGRINTEAYIPPPSGGGSGLIGPQKFSIQDDPAIKAKINACPYFALCDLVVWHNMDPQFLDPGIVTREEHQLLLLYSRAYYEKWSVLHSKADVTFPRVRIRYGESVIVRALLNKIKGDEEQAFALVKEMLFDDAALIGMSGYVDPDQIAQEEAVALGASSATPSTTASSSSLVQSAALEAAPHPDGTGAEFAAKGPLWETVLLDEAVRDHLSGRVLDFAGLSLRQQRDFFNMVDQMRRLVVIRKDLVDSETGAPVEMKVVIPYREAITLYDLYTQLGLRPYSGQIKVYDLLVDDYASMNPNGMGTATSTRICLTLRDEDSYFDFLLTNFYRANLDLVTVSATMTDDTDATARYFLTVEPEEIEVQRQGRWF